MAIPKPTPPALDAYDTRRATAYMGVIRQHLEEIERAADVLRTSAKELRKLTQGHLGAIDTDALKQVEELARQLSAAGICHRVPSLAIHRTIELHRRLRR